MNRKVAFMTLGCKVNQYETELIKEHFAENGFDPVSDGEPADVYVINTCTVTNLADRKSRQYIRRAKKQNPGAFVVVTGCYAETDRDAVSGIDGVSMVVGNKEKNNIPALVAEALGDDVGTKEHCDEKETGGQVIWTCDSGISGMNEKSRAFLKIEEGCDRFCSYCIIPYARGGIVSRDPEDIVAEAERLARAGYHEIVLTGINTALYGKDLGMPGIEPLIKMLDSSTEDFRIRLSSLEPTVVDRKDVEKLVGYGKLCHHLHLSVQSGSDGVLARMNRHYDREKYLDIVKALRDFDPLYGISTDIIVGFPGETESDFADSLDIVTRSEFVKVHAFRYSRRRGTKADAMPDQVQPKVKNARVEALAKHAEEVSERFREKCRGSEDTVLFEEKGEDGLLSGYSGNYVRVYARGSDGLIGRLCRTKLEDIYNDGMKGEIIDG